MPKFFLAASPLVGSAFDRACVSLLGSIRHRFIGRAANNFPFLPKNNVIGKKQSANIASFLYEVSVLALQLASHLLRWSKDDDDDDDDEDEKAVITL